MRDAAFWRRAILAVLVEAHCALAILFFQFSPLANFTRHDDAWFRALWGIHLSQMPLLAVWAVLGWEHIATRLPRVALLYLIGNLGAVIRLANLSNIDFVAMLTEVYVQDAITFLATCLALILLRAALGWRLTAVTRAGQTALPERSPLNLRDIMIHTTAAAVILTFASSIYGGTWVFFRSLGMTFSLRSLMPFVSAALYLLLVAVSSVELTLCVSRGLRFRLALVVLILAQYAAWKLVVHRDPESLFPAQFAATASILLSLLISRLAGVRLVTRAAVGRLAAQGPQGAFGAAAGTSG